MRIFRSPEIPAVVLVRGHGASSVAIPASLPPQEVHELVSLVLSASEYEEFQRAVDPSMAIAADPERPE
jgi:hypothetical protein